MTSSNPFLLDRIFRRVSSGHVSQMSLSGTMLKTFALLILTVASAGVCWYVNLKGRSDLLGSLFYGSAPLTLMLSILTVWKVSWAQLTAPVFAITEGIFLGSLSAIIERYYPGLAYKTVLLTIAVMGMMILLYKLKIVVVNRQVVIGVLIAIGGLVLIRLLTPLIEGTDLILTTNVASWLSIGVSVVAVCTAAFTIVLDFDFVEKAVSKGAPASLEWYGAFCLISALVWLYFEILILLLRLLRSAA